MVALGFAETVGVAVVNLLGCSPVYGALHGGSPCISLSCVPVAGDGLLKHPKAGPRASGAAELPAVGGACCGRGPARAGWQERRAAGAAPVRC